MSALLELRDVAAWYGSSRVLHGVSLEVQPGEVVAVLGANGAGKTTLMKAIMGLVSNSGAIGFDGRSLAGLKTAQIARRQVALVPEGRQIFAPFTVFQNLELGAISRPRAPRGDFEEALEQVYQLFPVLRNRSAQVAGTMSGGEQQMLAIGRALMARPKLLLMDEPSAGVAPKIVESILDAIRILNTQGLTILIVEQHTSLVLGLASRGYVLSNGRVMFESSAQALKDSEDLKRIYLGQESESSMNRESA
jgi:branched-chain amino acid transport system ATP-binding protein